MFIWFRGDVSCIYRYALTHRASLYIALYKIMRGTPRAYFTSCVVRPLRFFYLQEVWFNKLPLYEYGGTQALVGERSVPTGLFS